MSVRRRFSSFEHLPVGSNTKVTLGTQVPQDFLAVDRKKMVAL